MAASYNGRGPGLAPKGFVMRKLCFLSDLRLPGAMPAARRWPSLLRLGLLLIGSCFFGEMLERGRASADPAYATSLLESAEAEHRARAIELLGDEPGPQAIPPLVAALGDTDETVRAAAVSALKEREEDGEHVAQHALAQLQALPAPRRPVFVTSAVSLKELLAEPLVKRISMPDASVQEVLNALELLDPMRAAGAAEAYVRLAWSAHPGLSWRAAQALASIAGDAPDDAFEQLLRHPDSEIRITAINGLLAQNHPGRVALLLETAAGLQEPSSEVQRVAIRALAALEPRTAVPLLIDVLAKNQRRRRTTRAELIRLTQQDFGPEPGPWTQWWNEVRPDRARDAIISEDGNTVVRQRVGPAGGP